MKKALLVAMCFVMLSVAMVSDTFALPELNKVFANLVDLLGDLGLPESDSDKVNVEIISADKNGQILLPGGKVSRSARVDNLGTGDVYFRLVYAVQYDADSWNHLTVHFDAESGYTEHDWQDIRISGVPYKMKVFTYNSALPAGESSPDVRISIAMDQSITSAQIARYRSDFMKMQVLAIDPAPFNEKGYANAAAALDLALPLNTLNPF